MCLCHPAAAPTTGLGEPAWFPSCGGKQSSRQTGGEPNHLGKMQNPLITLYCVPNLVPFSKRKQHNLTTASRSQTWRPPSPSPQLCRVSNTDTSACTCPPLSSIVWMGWLHKSTHTSQKRNPNSVIHRRGIETYSPTAAFPHFNPQGEDCSYLSFILRTSNTSIRKD